MLAQLEIVPLGTGSAGVSEHLSKIAQRIAASGLDYQIGPMGTTVEGDWDAVMALAKQCHEAMFASAQRVMTTIIIDDRRDKSGPRMRQKLESLQKVSGVALQG